MRWFAFLKAINVGGHVVTMDRLRGVFVDLDLADAETFIASGNVTFTSRATKSAPLEKKIAAALHDALGYPVPTFLRNLGELSAIAAYAAFPATVMAAAKVVNVGFMNAPLSREALRTVQSFNTDVDRFASNDREFYWCSRTGQSESPFFKVRFERTFGSDVTFRTLNTVRRLLAKYNT